MKKQELSKIEKAEKTLNNAILKIIFWFSFLLDYKEDVSNFLNRHFSQICEHLQTQYQKARNYCKEFKKRHKEYIEKTK